MALDNVRLLPAMSLSDIFGKDFILNPRASFSDYGWLPKNPAKLDFLTGAPLTISGDMPVICSSSTETEEILNLLKKVNLEVAPLRYVYHTEREYRDILDKIARENKKMVVNHPHPITEIHPKEYWINPQLVGFLNNKANLEKLVPLEKILKRIVTHPSNMKKAIEGLKKLPVVVKAASDEPNGGGDDVIICYNQADIDKAADFFQSSSAVVIEEFVEISKNYNVQFARTINGEIVYIGASEQITSPGGIYLGNWVGKDHEPPEDLIKLGYVIMKSACSLGFIGVGGFDIIITNDNKVFAIDLNFRLNGSTAALLLKESIFKAHNASILLFKNWDSYLNWDKFYVVCQKAIDELNLIPLAFNKPIDSYKPNTACYISGIIFGNSKEDVLHKEGHFKKMLNVSI